MTLTRSWTATTKSDTSHIERNNKYQNRCTQFGNQFRKVVNRVTTNQKKPNSKKKKEYIEKGAVYFRLKRSKTVLFETLKKNRKYVGEIRKMEGSCYKSFGSACGLGDKTNNTHHTNANSTDRLKQITKSRRTTKEYGCCQIRYGLRSPNYRLGSVLLELFFFW